MILQASSGKRIRTSLTISGDTILPAEDTFKFLGMPVHVSSINTTARSALQDTLQKMLAAIDEAPLTPQQKLCLFKHGVGLSCMALACGRIPHLMAGVQVANTGS